MRNERLSWVELDRGAVAANVAAFKKRVGKVKLCVIVKANAYGHGIVPVSKIARKAGADWLGVATLSEGETLHRAGIRKPILILGYVTLSHLKEAVERRFHLTAFNHETLRMLGRITKRAGTKGRIHLKMETGTQRHGFVGGDIPSLAALLHKNPQLLVEGISMHFANIEDTTDHTYAMRQLDRFEELVHSLGRLGIHPRIKHTACTAATILFSGTHFDMVRLGIGTYGCWPSRETFVSATERRVRVSLRPALAWKTIVGQIKEVPAGSAIGYGGTFRTTRVTRIAILPVGYYDGYDRKLSNSAHVLIRGKLAPVRGRVCMDVTMADVTDIPEAALEDEVVLLGSQGNETISAEQLAGWAGTINYELLSRINPQLPRILI